MKLVTILLATYKPNMVYFEKLLRSLNDQSYSNIRILIRDDSDDEDVYLAISEMVEDIITNFDYVLSRNSNNLGSNRTFELLTKDALGEYLAYCDQDDIWEKEKISKLVDHIEKECAVLCYSDLSIINESDVFVANSFKDINKRLTHVYGENLFAYFLRRNSVTGCTMLIKNDIAKSAMPFCHEFFVHDHWLTLVASMKGRIAYIGEPLIKYRIHGNNQIGASILSGIKTREDYLSKKLYKERAKYEFLNNYKFNEYQKRQILKISKWTQKRINFFENRSIRSTSELLGSIGEDWQLIVFEVIINFIPKKLAEKVFKIVRR